MISRHKRTFLIFLALILVLVAAVIWLPDRSNPGGENTTVSLTEEASKATSNPTTSPVTASAEPSSVPSNGAEQVKTVSSEDPSLADVYADFFPIGAAIEPNQTEGFTSELLKKQVNWIVAENAMKPDAIEPSENVFTWDRADTIVAYAKANGMELRFHTLVWHNQTPDWFFRDDQDKPMIDETNPKKREANKALLLKRLDTYITTVVDRYKNDISSWDVVNEVIEPGDPDGIRASNWYKITGTDYIETAFRAARKAGGPNIKLYINDYGTDNPVKRDFLYDLVKEMLAKGVPIDGVGHQTHVNIEVPSIASIIESLQMFHDLGLDNQITELDMSLYVYNDLSDVGNEVPKEILDLQAERYRELFDALRAHKDLLSGVMFWGISDDHTWLSTFPITRTEAPLLFDKQLQAKPAFQAITEFYK